MPSILPRDGAVIFSDLIGKLDVLRVSCSQCARDGCYDLSRLITQRLARRNYGHLPEKDGAQYERPVRCTMSAIAAGALTFRKGLSCN